jgi:hypothetical protein
MEHMLDFSLLSVGWRSFYLYKRAVQYEGKDECNVQGREKIVGTRVEQNC